MKTAFIISVLCEGFSSERQQQSTSYLSVILMPLVPGHFFYSGKIKQHTSRSFLNFQLLTALNLVQDLRFKPTVYNPVMNKVKEAVRQT